MGIHFAWLDQQLVPARGHSNGMALTDFCTLGIDICFPSGDYYFNIQPVKLPIDLEARCSEPRPGRNARYSFC